MFSRRYGFNTVSTFIFEMFLFSFFFFQRSNSSTLSYIPTIGDHRKVLTCKAENPDLQNSAIQDSLPLQVHCKFIEMATTIILKGSETCYTNIYKYLIHKKSKISNSKKVFEVFFVSILICDAWNKFSLSV